MSAATSVQRTPVVVAVLLLAWTAFAPMTVFAQRAQPRGGGSSGGSAPSGGGSGGDRSGGRTTAPREGPRTAPRPSTAREAPREASRTTERSAEPADSVAAGNEGAPRTASASRRAGNDSATVGHAVPRRGPPPSTWDDRDHDHGYYPYWPGSWYGYYPWGYGGFGLGGYYASYYGPWYGAYSYGAPYGWTDEGSLRLKVKPRDASVFVDGYFVGRVDDFDGVFQRLHLDPGPHRIEVRADGYEDLSIEVRILPDRKITYEETLKPQR